MSRLERRVFLSGALLGLLALSGCGGSDDTPTPAALPTIGYLQYVSSVTQDAAYQGFLQGFAASGFVDGKNVRIDYINAGGSTTAAATAIQNLASQKVALIGTDGTQALQAAEAGTTTIPIVFGNVTDPIAAGAGTSDTSHRSNVTGVYIPYPVDHGVQLAAQILPGAKIMGTLYDPSEAFSPRNESLATQATQALGIQWVAVPVHSSADISNGVQQLKSQGVQAIMQVPSNTVNPSLPALITQAQQLGMPIFSAQPDAVSLGIVAAKGQVTQQAGYQAGQVTAAVLKGQNPATTPFVAATKEVVVVNLTAAKQFGVTIPQAVLQEADQVLP